MKFEPIFNRVIVKENKRKENKTKSGILLPDSVKETPCEAVVVAVCNKRKDKNCSCDNIESEIKVGDTILYPSYSAMEFYFDDQNYSIIKDEDILCKLIKDKEDDTNEQQ